MYRYLPLTAVLLAFLACACQSPSSGTPESPTVQEVVRARSFEVLDSRGVVRIRLSAGDHPDGAHDFPAFIELMDQNGAPLLILCGGSTPSQVNMADGELLVTGPYIALESAEDGVGVQLWLWQDEHKSRGLAVSSPVEDQSVRMIARTDTTPRIDHDPELEPIPAED